MTNLKCSIVTGIAIKSSRSRAADVSINALKSMYAKIVRWFPVISRNFIHEVCTKFIFVFRFFSLEGQENQSPNVSRNKIKGDTNPYQQQIEKLKADNVKKDEEIALIIDQRDQLRRELDAVNKEKDKQIAALTKQRDQLLTDLASSQQIVTVTVTTNIARSK